MPRTTTPSDGPAGPRLPPHNRAAERGVLGAMLRDPDFVPVAVGLLTREAFYFAHHGELFDLLRDLAFRGRPTDVVSAFEEAKRRRLADLDHNALADLWEAVPTAAEGEHYCKIVRAAWVGRRVAALCQETAAAALAGADGDEALAALLQGVVDIETTTSEARVATLAEALAEAMTKLDERARDRNKVGLLTGIEDLDAVTSGLHGGEMVILAARPSVGKSALAAQIAGHVAAGRKHVLFVSLEMKRDELAMRLAVAESGVHNQAVRKALLKGEEVARLAAAHDALARLPVRIDDAPEQTFARIASTARRLKAQGKLDLLVVDYVQLVQPRDRRLHRSEQVAETSRGMKGLAQRLDVPVLCLAQLNREVEGEKRKPRLADLKDSGSLEQDADTVLLLHRDDDGRTPQEERITVIVAKQRNGEAGAEVDVVHRRGYFRYRAYTPPA